MKHTNMEMMGRRYINRAESVNHLLPSMYANLIPPYKNTYHPPMFLARSFP
jgi:hypothetical protein